MTKSQGATIAAPKRSSEDISVSKLATDQNLRRSIHRAINDIDAGKTVRLEDFAEAVSEKTAVSRKTAARRIS